MNLTLIGLHLSSSVFSSPFISLPSSQSSPTNLIIFSNLIFNKHFSSFFRTQIHSQMNSQIDFLIKSCEMSNFLNQVIYFSKNSENITITGKSNAYGEPAVSPRVSFTCYASLFRNNNIPLEIGSDVPKASSGAAIYVSLPYAIEANITNSTFRVNRAPFGGAIFFTSVGGNLIIHHCVFDSNQCYVGQGAHLFIGTHKGLDLQNINFILGGGNTSVFIIADASNESLELDMIRFYQNEGPILVDSGATVQFLRCCFTKFSGSGNNLQYIPSNLISDRETHCTFIIDDSCVNYGIANGLTLTASEIASRFEEIGKNRNEQHCEGCRLVPTPSHTMSARVSLACAKEAIIAICCCVFISILGICIVIGLSKSEGAGESMDHSN